MPNSLRQRVVFAGRNFGNLNLSALVTVKFGPFLQPDRFSCDVDPLLFSDAQMVCITQDFAFGDDLQFSVTVANHNTVRGTDTLQFLGLPRIFSITGCPGSINNRTTGCSTRGAKITISGENFEVTLTFETKRTFCARFSCRTLATSLWRAKAALHLTCSLLPSLSVQLPLVQVFRTLFLRFDGLLCFVAVLFVYSFVVLFITWCGIIDDYF
jgi:hypothetical protein